MLDRTVVDVADDVCFPPGVCMLTMTVADAADDVCWQQVDAE